MNARTLLLTFGLACIAAATPSVDSLAPDATDEMREALETAPPEAIYNAGVQMFRAGNFEAARDLFSTAASRGKESVAARSMYNLGTSGYADALKLLQPAEGGGVGSPPTDTSSDGAPVDPTPVNPRDQAISALEAALRELKDAMRADPKNIDARANAEMAHRLLKSLKEEQKQEQKNDEKNDEKKDEKKDEKNDGKQDKPQDGDGKPSDEQKQQEKEQQEKKNKDDSKGEKKDEKKDEKKGEKPSDDKTPPTEEAKQDQAKGEQKPMSKQEVERVLQKIRDRERERIQAKLQRERARTLPAPKDW
jgi:Ca-activated chloride channel family protein